MIVVSGVEKGVFGTRTLSEKDVTKRGTLAIQLLKPIFDDLKPVTTDSKITKDFLKFISGFCHSPGVAP